RAYETIHRRAFDIVHDNSGLIGILVASQARLQAPVVATLHGSLTEAEGDFLRSVARQVGLIAISRAQQATVAGLEWHGVVHNAIDPAEYTPVTRPEEKEGYLVELARINPDKGQHIAIKVAKRLNVPLVLAGKDKRDVQAFGHLDRDVLALIGIDAGELDQVALLLLRPGDRRVLRRVDRVVHHAVPLQARHGGLLGAADGDQ